MQVTAVFPNRDGTIRRRTIWRQAESGFDQGPGHCTKTLGTLRTIGGRHLSVREPVNPHAMALHYRVARNDDVIYRSTPRSVHRRGGLTW